MELGIEDELVRKELHKTGVKEDASTGRVEAPADDGRGRTIWVVRCPEEKGSVSSMRLEREGNMFVTYRIPKPMTIPKGVVKPNAQAPAYLAQLYAGGRSRKANREPRPRPSNISAETRGR